MYRKFTSKQKLEIVLASLRGDRSVAELCREHGIAESLLRKWPASGAHKVLDEVEVRGDAAPNVLPRAPDLADQIPKFELGEWQRERAGSHAARASRVDAEADHRILGNADLQLPKFMHRSLAC